MHNAWFYYLTAWDLLAPVDFMSTPQLDKVADEMQAARPGDVPSAASPLSLSAGGTVFKVSEIAPVPIDDNLYLRIVYATPDAANPRQANQDNMAVIKALLAKYPEAARRVLRRGRPRGGRQRPRLRLRAGDEGH